jgi:predicted Zn-dependent protease
MLASRPEDSRLQFAVAVEYLKADRVRDGVAALRAYLASTDDEGNAWGRLATALSSIGEDEEARDAYHRGIDAARRHGHPTMAEEFEAELQRLGV